MTRFDDFHERLGISRNVLNHASATSSSTGVLERVAYREHPPRYDYRLTDKGSDLWPVLTAMRQWGDRWAAPDGPPLEVVHNACGHISELVPTCSECGQRVAARDVRAIAGPGQAIANSSSAREVQPERPSRSLEVQAVVMALSGRARSGLRTRPDGAFCSPLDCVDHATVSLIEP